MNFNRSTHFSIVWGVTLAVLTLLEWRTLDRDPIGHQILTPFIEREISIALDPGTLDGNDKFDADRPADEALRYEVEIRFNGPLFLACFFGPVLLFLGIGKLAARFREG